MPTPNIYFQLLYVDVSVEHYLFVRYISLWILCQISHSFGVGVLRQVEAKLCRTLALQDQVWWNLPNLWSVVSDM